MDRRISPRVETDLPIRIFDQALVSEGRVRDVSSDGILIMRNRPVLKTDHSALLKLQLSLPERLAPLEAHARSVWSSGQLQALRFVRMEEIDRLNLAEHVDSRMQSLQSRAM